MVVSRSSWNATSCFLILIFTMLPVTMARGQQGPDAALKGKARDSLAIRPTLLVLCDLACNWKLDGELQGHIAAGRGAKVKVESGQHVVEAYTEDGIDQVKLFSIVKPTGQTLIDVSLEAIREERLDAYNRVLTKLSKEAEDNVAHERQESQLRERNAENRELAARQQALAHEPWADPTTGLMWTRWDNGSDLSWQQATDYCKNLDVGGRLDWRLPTTGELQGVRGVHPPALKGSIQVLGGAAWSSIQIAKSKGHLTERAFILVPSYYGDGLELVPIDGRDYSVRALCVSGPHLP